MNKYVDALKLGTVLILSVELVPLSYLTWKWGREVVDISMGDPQTFFRGSSERPEKNIVMTIVHSEGIRDWLIFLLIFICYFIPQILAVTGLLKKKPLCMEPYIHIRMVHILFGIILVVLVVITFLSVEYNEAYVETAIVKSRYNNSKAENSQDKLDICDFQKLERFLFSMMIVSIVITYVLYYLMSVVNSYRLRLKEEETYQRKTIPNYQRLQEEAEV